MHQYQKKVFKGKRFSKGLKNIKTNGIRIFKRICKEGDIIGEKAVLGSAVVRSATLITMTEVDVMVIHKKHFASIKEIYKVASSLMIK